MIPNIIHFMYFGGIPFSLVHYLAIKSAHVVNNPRVINFYYEYEPSGEWWEKSKHYLNPIRIKPPTEVFGFPLCHPAHQADVVRLQVLIEQGGIYLDIDVICVKPLTHLLNNTFVLGQQGIDGNDGLCNAVILSQKDAFLAKRWLEGFDPQTSFWNGFRSQGFDEYWDELSVRYPAFLAKIFPEHICVQDYRKFHWPLFTPDDLEWLFKRDGDSFKEAYCHHLWQSNSWEPYLKDLTVDSIKNVDNNFNRIVRSFL